MGNYIIKNAYVFSNESNQLERKNIAISNGVFVDTYTMESRSKTQIVDGTNKLLLPGMIDLHNDEIERFIAPKRENFFCDFDVFDKMMLSYFNNGITTVFLALTYSSEPGIRNMESTKRIVEKISEYKRNVRFPSSIQVNLRIEMSADWSNLIQFIENNKKEIGVVTFCDHALNNSEKWDIYKYHRYVATRAKIGETDFTELVIEALKNRQNNILQMESVLSKIKKNNLRIGFHDIAVSSEQIKNMDFAEFPTNMEIIQILHSICKPVVMGAPNIRNKGSINNNVSAFNVCKMNLCDVLCSDYDKNSILKSICILSQEVTPNFYHYYKLVSENPAHILQVKKGKICKGYDADCILIDMNLEKPHVSKTFVRGRIVYDACF